MARGKGRKISGARGSTQRITRERAFTGTQYNHGVVGTGSKLAAGGAARSADQFSPPAVAKSRGSNPAGRLGGTLRRGSSRSR